MYFSGPAMNKCGPEAIFLIAEVWNVVTISSIYGKLYGVIMDLVSFEEFPAK